jgi:hypothetical protein
MTRRDDATALPAMEGRGFYNRNSAMQAAGIAVLAPLWDRACRTVAVDEAPLVVVDYAASQGRNSMAPMRAAIETLRARTRPDRPIEIVHTDLPSNDFASLFRALEEDPASYRSGLDGIYISAIGRSYFEQLLPDGRATLGWNTWSMQWLSEGVGGAADHALAGMTADPALAAAVRARQAADWRRFLAVRARELRRGGRLLTAYTARAEAEAGWEWLLGSLWEAILDLGRDGLLTAEEQRRLTIPIGLRTLAEIEAPFKAGDVRGLTLEHAELVRVPDPFRADFDRTGDARLFAQRHADTTRAWSGPALAGLLGPRDDNGAVIDALFARLAGRLAAAPQTHEPTLAVVLLRRD